MPCIKKEKKQKRIHLISPDLHLCDPQVFWYFSKSLSSILTGSKALYDLAPDLRNPNMWEALNIAWAWGLCPAIRDFRESKLVARDFKHDVRKAMRAVDQMKWWKHLNTRYRSKMLEIWMNGRCRTWLTSVGQVYGRLIANWAVRELSHSTYTYRQRVHCFVVDGILASSVRGRSLIPAAVYTVAAEVQTSQP